ncbi:MAG: hypothetical protein K2Q18_13010, partial [Bdellovibrionales bacterium]|nr:hypothetical protein [Bdellovibrionales bacterium]
YQVEDYSDMSEENVVVDDSIERLQEVLTSWLQRHISSQTERARFLKDMTTPQKLINNLCLLVIKDIEIKEILLASVSLQERIRLMNALLRGKSPEIEDNLISEAIKDFERLDPVIFKNAL